MRRQLQPVDRKLIDARIRFENFHFGDAQHCIQRRGAQPALMGIGVVLNQLDIDKANKYYGGYRGYGGRYYRNYGYAGDSTQNAGAVSPAAENKAS